MSDSAIPWTVSPPGSSVHGILQAEILMCVAISFSRGSTWEDHGDSYSKESACNAGDAGSIPGSGSSPGEGNGHPLQYSCLENSVDKGASWTTVRGVAKRQT